MLPLLTAATSFVGKKKPVKKSKLLPKASSAGGSKTTMKKPSAITLRPSSGLNISTKTISADSLIPSKKPKTETTKVSAKKSSIDEIRKELSSINSTLESIKSFIKGEIASQKKSERKKTVQRRKFRFRQRESKIESKKGIDKKKKGIAIQKPGMSFLDSIINYLTNVLLGTLSIFALSKLPEITKAFDNLIKNFTIWDTIRYGIISLTTNFPKLIKFFLKAGKKLLSGPFKLIGKTIKFSVNKIGSIFKKIGSKVFNLLKGPLKQLLGPNASRILGGTAKGVTSIASRGARRVGTRTAAVVGGKTAARTVARFGLLTSKGLRHFAKIGAIFKRVPIIGALIGLGIDLALGTPPDEAIVGAIGATIGAAIGGGIGSLILPFAGTAAGGIVGGMIGDWLGKELYKALRPKITEILPQEDEEEVQRRSEGGGNNNRNSSSRVSRTRTPRASVASSAKRAFNLIYNIAKKVGGTKYPEVVAAQAMHETGFLNPSLNSVYNATRRTNAFGQTGDRGFGTIPRSGFSVGWTLYPDLKTGVKDHIKLWHDVRNHPKNYNAFNSIIEGIASVAPAYSPNADPANIRLGYTVDKYSKSMVKILKDMGFNPMKGSGQRRVIPMSSTSDESNQMPGYDVEANIQPPDLHFADIRGAINKTRARNAMISSTNAMSKVAPSISQEPSYQIQQDMIMPFTVPPAQPQTSSNAGGGFVPVPIESGLNSGVAYREILNVSLYKR